MYKISITPEELEALEPGGFTGEIQIIDSEGPDFDAAISYLRRQKVIGFDTESRPSFTPESPRYGVSLLQLSGAKKAFLFRIKKLGMHKRLCSILADWKILKIGAAVKDDVRGLEKYHNFAARSFVDLQEIGYEYGIRDKSVKKLAGIILGIKISKKEQLSNWEAERLTEPQQRYAATDAWVCREMYLKLMDSEKHPLTAEERISPAQRAAEERQRAEAAAARAAREAEAAQHPEQERQLSHREQKRREYNRKRRQRRREKERREKLAKKEQTAQND